MTVSDNQFASGNEFVADVKRAVIPATGLMLIALGVFIIGLLWSLLLISGNTTDQHFKQLSDLKAAIGFSLGGGLGLVSFILGVMSVFKRQKPTEVLLEMLAKDTEALDQIPANAFWIAFAAALGLYLELMMIRMHGATLQLFAYYKNVSLMSCFLGLGIGYALNKKRPILMAFVLPLMAVQLLFLNYLKWADFSYLLRNPATEQATFEVYTAYGAPDQMISFGFIIAMFILNALSFIPVGQLASRIMSRAPKLYAYGWNLVGSLVGIALFAALCFLWMPPPIWVAIGVIGTVIFLRKRAETIFPSVIAAVLIVAALAIPPRSFLFKPMKYDIFSPYQTLTVILDHGWPRIFSNNTWLQSIVDLSPNLVAIRDDLKPISNYYGLPYQFKPDAEEVLIVGSGTGNDIAAAIRGGAKHIDAVEIDPGIIQIGSSLHPENPYQSAKVKIINDDARHFIRHTKKKYDLIVYGLLDSTTTLTAHSGGVRMDSYVWTVEGFKESRKLLKPNGIISCSVCILPVLTPKVFAMLKEAFDGKTPIVYNTVWDSGYTFVVGDDVQKPESIKFEELTAEYVKNQNNPVDLATDDWPFLWMFHREYPFSYALIILVLVSLSLFMVKKFLPLSAIEGGDETETATEGKPQGMLSRFSWPCFFLGAGFMLVETKGITELALVYGSTWFVTSIVIAAIILLALVANTLVAKGGAPHPAISYGLLFAALAAGYTVSLIPGGLGSLGPVLEPAAITLLLTLPLFFSGFAFSSELSKSSSIAVALSSNLLGGMVGGFVEYNSLYFGYRSLYLFALAMYALAFISSMYAAKKAKSDESAQPPQAEVVAS